MRNWILCAAAILFVGCGTDRDAAVTACAEAINALDTAAVTAKCDGLPLEEQRKAAQMATAKNGVLVFIPPYEAKKAREEAVAEGEPVEQPRTFKEVRALAMQGNYQAQRNLAYSYSSRPYDGQDMNPILGCAWRTVIIQSGNEKVNETDVGNHEVYCGKLDPTARAAADAQAAALLQKIR